MPLTLGLDVGERSIGWALIDEEGEQIVASGVRIFPLGVDSTQSGEKPKNVDRRVARGTRRLLRRRARRKRQLRELLVSAGLLPPIAQVDRDDPARIAWERDSFREADPYVLRKKALDERLEPHELGRALVHLNQRRGFKSNRKADRERKETSEMLEEINELQRQIKESGARTLGEYLANQIAPEEQNSQRMAVPVDPEAPDSLRRRHTMRRMYIHEFIRIWNKQREYHPELLTRENRKKILHTIFFQRPIRPPSTGLIGACELLPRLPRAPRADRRVQQMRMYQEVNNLRLIDLESKLERPLSSKEREKLIKFLSKKKEAKFEEIRKHLFSHPDNVRFNLERADRTKLHGMPIDHALAQKKLIGTDWWIVEDRLKNWIVAAIIDDDVNRLTHLLEQAELDPALAEKLLEATPLESSYGSYSLKAVKDLLPHVIAGLPLYSRDASVPSAYRNAGYLAPWERTVKQAATLGQPPEVTNPIVRQALFEVRKVVNAILREFIHGQQQELGCIRIELARSAKNSINQRAEIIKEQRKNETRRTAARNWVEGYRGEGQARATDIEKYLLWKEQGELCIYSGVTITPQQLLSSETDLDHILPRWKSGDNSQMNKVVCFRKANADKKDRTPMEWLSERDPERFERIIKNARKLPYPKFKRFLQKHVDPDFVARQLTDTSYITTQVRSYLLTLGVDVEPVSGRYTSILRHRWGLELLLSQLEDSPAWLQAQQLKTGEKNRLDQRHHAIDAIVVALTDRKRVHNLGTVIRNEHARELGYLDDLSVSIRAASRLRDPWNNFRNDVVDSIRAINISYRASRRASGPLHEATVYGPTNTPGVVVVRKDISVLSLAEVERIRDPRDKAIIVERLAQHGFTPGRGSKQKLTSEVWKEPLWKNKEKGVRIKKVRVVKNESSVLPIRGGQVFVKPGNIHHFCVFQVTDYKGTAKLVNYYVSMIEAANRIRQKEPIIQRRHPEYPEAKFMFSLSNNEMLLIEHQGKEELYRLVTSASTSNQMWFKHHCAGGESSSKIGEISKKPGTLKARKVTVDPIGRIRWAND